MSFKFNLIFIFSFFFWINVHAQLVAPVVSASPISQSQINISWTDKNINVKNYLIQRSLTSSGGFTNLVTLAGSIKSYANSGLSANTTYYYKVRAINQKNKNGPFSTIVSAKTLKSPVAGTDSIIDATKAYFDSGYGYIVTNMTPTSCDSNANPILSTMQVFENGLAIGPAHSLHADIRTLGKGRYSHWCDSSGASSLYFSSSDNSDPRTNGKTYTFKIATIVNPPAASISSLGPQPVQATDLSKGTYFASPSGTGSICSLTSPCNLQTASDKAIAGNVVFLRGGIYNITQNLYFRGVGQVNSLITFESYPGELAILDGKNLNITQEIYIRITGSYIALRKLEIRNMPKSGLWIGGVRNLVDGLNVHHNKLSGIQVFSPYDNFPYGQFGSYNTIQNCTVTDNSGAGINDLEYADGGNSDGISISSGEGNKAIYNYVARNSDDGIDSWRSTNTYIGYNMVTASGIASGNGNGIKAGGAAPSNGTIVEHNLSYKNMSGGFDTNSGMNVTFRKNTSWSNVSYGFYTYASTLAENNISFNDGDGFLGGSGIARNNSWQRSGSVMFINTDPASMDFLKPLIGGGFDDIGAYAP